MNDAAQASHAVVRYARRLHAVTGTGQHVASPLGAWLLLALSGAAASGRSRDDLADALGCPVQTAAATAGELLARPHPQVPSASGFWRRPVVDTPALARWLAGLPGRADTGYLSGQAALNEWARQHTFGLIKEFPIALTSDVLFILATALATKISWAQPFTTVPAATLGSGSAWATSLRQVLRAPPAGGGHRQFIAVTPLTGDVAVQAAPGGREERCAAVLPAWSAASEHNLAADPRLGFAAAAAALSELTGVDPGPFQAIQAAVARYSRTGFEAAAVTGIARTAAALASRRGVIRMAELRFGHPYAVVAVALGEPPWHGMPVFSAWITTPDDAGDPPAESTAPDNGAPGNTAPGSAASPG